MVETLQAALSCHGKPQIINSDQGSQFTCNKWVAYLKEREILISMDGKGRISNQSLIWDSAIDNVYIERSWRTVKYEV
ncbi:hypothetical protein ACFPQ1_36590, partial [Rhodocytophaga aerolata]